VPNTQKGLSNQAALGHEQVFTGTWSAKDEPEGFVVRHNIFSPTGS